MTRECHVCGANSEKSWRCSECGADLAGREENDVQGGRDVLADGSGHVCDACGEGFQTLTRLRLHEKDDCPERAMFDKIDPDDPDAGLRGAEGLLTCRNCDRENPDADYEQTASLADDDYHLIVEFGCRHCGFENENRLVMEGIDRDKIDQLPPEIRPVETDGGVALEQCSTHDLVMRALEDLDDQEAADGIPTDDVVEWVTERTESTSADVHDAIGWLKSHGEIYAPAADHLRRTSPGDGWSA